MSPSLSPTFLHEIDKSWAGGGGGGGGRPGNEAIIRACI